MDILKTNA